MWGIKKVVIKWKKLPLPLPIPAARSSTLKEEHGKRRLPDPLLLLAPITGNKVCFVKYFGSNVLPLLSELSSAILSEIQRNRGRTTKRLPPLPWLTARGKAREHMQERARNYSALCCNFFCILRCLGAV